MSTGESQTMEFGSLLRHYRKRARLTQNELAGLSTVSLRTIRNLESGQACRPRLETVRMLANGLQLTADSWATLSMAIGHGETGVELGAMQGRLPDPRIDIGPELVGRDRELDLLLRYLRTGGSHIISIAGFGGVGKSRLAAALAQSAQQTHQMPWLWLQPAQPTDSIRQTEGLFAKWYADLACGRPAAIDEVARLLGNRPSLLILDGVGDGVGDGVSDGVSDGVGDSIGNGIGNSLDELDTTLLTLTGRCPRLTVVETTRTATPRDGRFIVPLKPLHLPDAQSLMDKGADAHPALHLLLPLIRVVAPDFEESTQNLNLALDICRSLDGLPRALQAAASWFAFYPPAVVAKMAREQPCTLAAADGTENWVAEALSDALCALTQRQQALLLQLVERPTSWTVDEIAMEAGLASNVVVESLHGLLALGLIRLADGDSASAPDARRFMVLNLVRDHLHN